MRYITIKPAVGLVVGGLLMLLSVQYGPTATALPQSDPVALLAAADSPGPVLMSYQGRLLNPSTGEPKTDGAYAMVFALYNVVEGGSPLWSETDSVNVKGGQFATLLGDQTPLVGTVLSTEDLWLGVTVGSDPEAAPRQRVAYAAYAIRAVQAGYAGAAGDANTLDGADSSAFAPATHAHLGQTWTAAVGGDALAIVDATVVINTGFGDGLRVDAATDDGLQVSSAAYGVYIVSTTNQGVLIGSAGGEGIRINGAGLNGVYVATNNQYDTVYANNGGTGKSLSAYSESGTAAWFGSNVGADLIVAEEYFSDPPRYETRFRVARWGDVRADGTYYGANYATGGADFAELLPAAAGLSPGDVLVIGADGLLSLSSSPNALNVAGVFSTQPGIVGGVDLEAETSQMREKPAAPAVQAAEAGGLGKPEVGVAAADVHGDRGIAGSAGVHAQGEAAGPDAPAVEGGTDWSASYADTGKAPLAIVGVVPVKVTDEGGPIVPGDLLTTSSTPGHAMKATPVDVGGVSIYRPGTIVGKALAPLASGAGVIDVLLLQQ